MGFRFSRWICCGLGIALVPGCLHPVRQNVDHVVCDLAARPMDLSPASREAPAKPQTAPAKEETPSKSPGVTQLPAKEQDEGLRLASFQLPQPAGIQDKPARPLAERLKIPPELPGADAPPVRLPPPTAPRQEKEAAIEKLFPPLPDMGPDVQPAPGPEGHALTLSDLQRLAMSNSPVVRQAAADVEAARGAAIQASLYPNPTVGYEGDAMNQGRTAGQQGAFVQQTVKTAGKLKLAEAAAVMDIRNAELALKRSQADVAARVRAGYFAVLVARESVRVTEALARFTDEVYRIQVDLVRGEQAAAYEPIQVRVLAFQVRGSLIQARNRYVAAWKQLAATLGLPGMPLTELAGKVDQPIPVLQYDKTLLHVLNQHTDVLTAVNSVQKARYNLRLAQVTPISDVDVRVMSQRDHTQPPSVVMTSVMLGIQLPVWDRNQGNILQAQSSLLRANEEEHRVRSDLTSRLAEAFQRYENSRVLLAYYEQHILPDQVRAYRGVYERHQQEPNEVSFPDVVSAQQTLAAAITTYISTLGDVWTSVVDVANLLQTDDLFQVTNEQQMQAVPTLDHLMPLPCCHPCSPLPDPQLKAADPTWPAPQAKQ